MVLTELQISFGKYHVVSEFVTAFESPGRPTGTFNVVLQLLTQSKRINVFLPSESNHGRSSQGEMRD